MAMRVPATRASAPRANRVSGTTMTRNPDFVALGLAYGFHARQFRLHLGQLDTRECTGLHRTRSLVVAASAEVVSLGPELRVFHPQRVRDRGGLSPGALRLREQVMVRMLPRRERGAPLVGFGFECLEFSHSRIDGGGKLGLRILSNLCDRRLIRVRYGPFNLPPQLKRGRVHELNEVEVKALVRELDKMIRPPETPQESA